MRLWRPAGVDHWHRWCHLGGEVEAMACGEVAISSSQHSQHSKAHEVHAVTGTTEPTSRKPKFNQY